MNHIILSCVYSREVWHILLSRLHLADAVTVQEGVILWWLRSRKLVDKQLRKDFDSLLFLVGWNCGKNETFGGPQASPVDSARKILEEGRRLVLCRL